MRLREGDDVTLVGWARSSRIAAAAECLAVEGVVAEVIDVATLAPLDAATILSSVAKTGRCVTVRSADDRRLRAEIAAQLAGPGLLSLLAPVERVTGYDTVVPLPCFGERHALLSVDLILAAVRCNRWESRLRGGLAWGFYL